MPKYQFFYFVLFICIFFYYLFGISIKIRWEVLNDKLHNFIQFVKKIPKKIKMKKLKLTANECFFVLQLMNEVKGSLDQMRQAMKIQDIVFLTTEDRKAIGIRPEKRNGKEMMVWDNVEWTKAVELSEEKIDLIKTVFNKKNDDKTWEMNDARTADILEKKLDGIKEEKKS